MQNVNAWALAGALPVAAMSAPGARHGHGWAGGRHHQIGTTSTADTAGRDPLASVAAVILVHGHPLDHLASLQPAALVLVASR